ncbi:hypothetical protein HYH03_012976 [Edaphochlamys debaryana]|uniref:PAS domain-containing protein n=1 Tax=Edaphochlamys debaryana TaxID=47281 RepID=A0A836BTE8_9CHLO|nr:hypothetical protein HYH03_012976 [Edaphochlamys debaryana]|eukprot:KAG2488471.1 hypothetical protein HYH03_012976 [Edaphochlamys debaryana]
MVFLLVINVMLCVWVAWCFSEQKFPVVWPIKVLRVFSSVFFQAFDVACLNLLQLGIACRYTGPQPHLYMSTFTAYSCASAPHLIHAVVSALALILFVAIALLLNMAEVEVNPTSRRPFALGHSGAEVAAFAVKVLLTLVDVFLGWNKVAAVAYLVLSLAHAWPYLRRNPHLVLWVNCLKSGVAMAIAWVSTCLVLLVFEPGVDGPAEQADWQHNMTVIMLAGLGPTALLGAALSYTVVHRMTVSALRALATAKPETPLKDVCDSIDDPRDVEVVARCGRVWRDRYTLDPEAVARAHQVIKAGLAMFPGSAFMVLLHANFMIDVLGVHQSGSRRIEDARKLSPSLMCRFIMFVRHQQATQKAAGSSANDGASMDLLDYVEYQRKQRMVVRLHKEALQAMCAFWRALDSSTVSFVKLSKALGSIERSVSQAQTAYRVVLESYGRDPKLVRLYGKFLESIKNDPWGAAEYYAEADRLEETKNADGKGPLLPDGTPLGRMDEMAMAVLVINATGVVQMANKQTYAMYGYKRGALDGKPLALLLSPHAARRLTDQLAEMVIASTGAALPTALEGSAEAGRVGSVAVAAHPAADAGLGRELVVVGMHIDRVAFPVKLMLRKASGVGEDSTFLALMEPLPPSRGLASLWVSPNGTVTACDPQFVANFGWRATEVQGSGLTALLSVSKAAVGSAPGQAKKGDEEAPHLRGTESSADLLKRLLARAKVSEEDDPDVPTGLQGLAGHKYDTAPVPVTVSIVESTPTLHDAPIHEVRVRLVAPDPPQLMVVSRKGAILHASTELAVRLKDAAGRTGHGPAGPLAGGGMGGAWAAPEGGGEGAGAEGGGSSGAASGSQLLTGFKLPDFLPSPWRDMHVKLLKDTTAQSPPARSHWSCRQGGPNTPGPTLELRTITGQPLFVTVSVTTRDLSGEPTHVIRMGRSSLPAALAERRVRLSVGADGVVVSATEGPAASMLRLEPTQVVGRGLWELITEQGPHGLPSGPPMLAELMDRAMEQPGHSWRVRVSSAVHTRSNGTETGSVVRGAIPKPAVMQVFAEGSLEEGEAALAAIGGLDIPVGGVVVDLWPATNVSGVLQLDATGRVSQVLEEATRPAGLLFGMPSSALVGSSLAGLVVLPPGRSGAQDLLTLTGAKKSSLKKQQGEAHVVVGPTHVLQAMHADSEPLTLDVQVVGKPGPGQTATVILRPHAAPMMPAAGVNRGASFLVPPSRSVGRVESRKVQTGATLLLEPPSAGPAEKPELSRNLSNLRSSAADSKSRGPTPPSGTAPAAIPPSSPANLTNAGGDGQPASNSMSGSTTGGKAAAAAGRSRIAEMVARRNSITLPPEEHPGATAAAADTKEPAAEPVPPKAGSPPASGSRRLSAGIAPPITAPGDEPQQAEGPGSKPHTLPGSTEPGAPKDHLDELEELLSARPQTAARDAGDHDSEAGDGSDSEKGKKKHKEGEGRVSQWVTSKGAFYQNSVAPTHKSEDVISEVSDALNSDTEGGEAPVHQRPGAFGAAGAAGAGLGAGKGAAAGGKGAAEPPAEVDIDDGASDGGQSAMSAQSSSGGAEYKRGKRFRKLARLMDSNQAQQVQHRFRVHAVITVLLLAAVHLACFILTITMIDQKREGMVKLGDSGQAGLYMHQMLTDVRSLDVISRNMTIDYLYTAEDADFFINRVAKNAEVVKASLNNILEANHDKDSAILQNLYYTTITVWNGWEADGSDSWIDVTVWDFATRFYAMAKNIEQHAREWLDEGLVYSEQFPVGFLLRSGPQLYQETREVMDALVDKSVHDVEMVDTLQLVFLAVEGAAITCLAACYLAYLLRAVAAQRYKLYGTFLLIPVGLTRALASQDINAAFNDEDESDDEEDGPREPAKPELDDEEEGGAGAPKHQKRRATLAVRGEGGDGTDGGGYGEGGAGGRRNSMMAGPERSATFGSDMRSSPPKGRWGKFKMQMRRVFRRNSGSVSPLPVSGGGKGGAAPPAKRQLKNDSNDTAVLLVPFLLWSALVIGIYVASVVQMKSIVDVVAIHAVSNFLAGRTYRTIYYSQELAVTYDPAGLPKAREDLAGVLKLVRDAWYTLQLGKDAYLAAGPDTEQFQKVEDGLAYASPGINKLLHSNGYCHRQPANAPCPGPEYRFNKIIHTGLDSMMSQFLISAWSQAANKSMVPEGLEDEHFDFIYNVGTVDLIDGNIELEDQHNMILNDMYDRVILLHIILFVMLWIIFAGFLFLLLNPLLHRITKERRRIAELMSQLPLELDVEKLVERALVVGGGPGGNGNGGAAGGGLGGVGGMSMRRGSVTEAAPAAAEKRVTNMSDDTAAGGGHVGDDAAAATTKWKAIIREASFAAGTRPGGRRSSVEMDASYAGGRKGGRASVEM